MPGPTQPSAELQPPINALQKAPSYIPIQFKLLAISQSGSLAEDILGLINDIHVVEPSIDSFQKFCETYNKDPSNDNIARKTLLLSNRLIGESHKYIKAYLECITSVNGKVVTYGTADKGTSVPKITEHIDKYIMNDFITNNNTLYIAQPDVSKKENITTLKDYIISLQLFYNITPTVKPTAS